MFDIGGGELIVIVLAILVLFGPKKIPEIAQMIGKGMQQFKKAQAQFENQLKDIQKDINIAVQTPANAVKRHFSITPIITDNEIKEEHNGEDTENKSKDVKIN